MIIEIEQVHIQQPIPTKAHGSKQSFFDTDGFVIKFMPYLGLITVKTPKRVKAPEGELKIVGLTNIRNMVPKNEEDIEKLYEIEELRSNPTIVIPKDSGVTEDMINPSSCTKSSECQASQSLLSPTPASDDNPDSPRRRRPKAKLQQDQLS